MDIQRRIAATLKPTRRGCKGGKSRRHRELRRDPTNGRIVGQVRKGGGGELELAETAKETAEMAEKMKTEGQNENEEKDADDTEDEDKGAGGESTTMVEDARVEKGGDVELREGSDELTGIDPRTKTIKTQWQGANPGTDMYENPLLRVDEDDEYEYGEDDNGVMVVARTPPRRGERPSLKAATARALAAEETSRRLEEQVQGLQAQLRGDYVVQAEELKEPGYTGDAADQVIILDMALDFSRVRVKTVERELNEMKKKFDAAETQTVHWRKWGEEAEAKLRIRVGEREARVVGAAEIATVQAEVEEARDETEEWKGRAEEAEAKLEERERERERERGEFEEKVAGIDRELAKVDVMEEEMERLKKEQERRRRVQRRHVNF